MKKVIGILGGISAESTAVYYEQLIKRYFALRGDYYYPEIVIYSLDFQHFTDFEDTGDRAGYVEYIIRGIGRLEAAGADFIIMSANSPHAVFDEVSAHAAVPMLSIAEVTAQAAKQLGLQKLLLMGIKFTMQSTFYQTVCAPLGIDVVVPTEAEQDEINRIIFDELTIGIFRTETKARLLEIADGYAVEGVILGCTELPLILSAEDSDKTLLNTLALHVDATLTYALS